MESILLLKILCTGGIAAGAVGTGYALRGPIARVFTGNKKLAGDTGEKDSVTESVYVVAKYIKSEDIAKTDGTPEEKTTKHGFVVNYVNAQGVELSEKDIDIYSISAPEPESKGIDFSTSIAPANKVSKSLNIGNTYYVKLSTAAFDAINATKSFKVAYESEGTKNLASFALKSGAITETIAGTKKTIELTSSNLLVVKIASNKDALSSETSTVNLNCSVGLELKNLPCLAYKFASDHEPLTQDKFKNFSLVSNPKDNLAVGKYLLIDLQTNLQTLNKLEHQVVVFKKERNKELAKGLVEQLLIGSIDDSNLSNPEAYIVESPLSKLDNKTEVSKTEFSYVMTQGGTLHESLKKTDPINDKYICRVIDATKKYEDDKCILFKFDKNASNFSFDKAAYADNGSSKITTFDDLAAGKQQLVKLSKTLADKLKVQANRLLPKLEIINKSSKDAAWNNRFVGLTKVKDVFHHTDGLNTLKSNVLLARVKSKVEATTIATATTEGPNTSFVCHVDSDTLLDDCKLYSFKSAKKANNISSVDISEMTTWGALTTAFEVGHYYAIELNAAYKSLAEIQNKVITLKVKGTGAQVVEFEFDQLIYGKPSISAALHKRDEAIFIVKKTTPNAGEDLAVKKQYRCKWSKAQSKLDNFDDDCTLTKLPTATNSATIPSLQNLKSNTTRVTAELKLKNDTDTFYRLTFDKNKLYNINTSSFDDAEIKIQILSMDSSPGKDLGTVQLLHNITDTTTIGKTDLLIAQTKKAAIPQADLTAGTCAYSDAKTTSFTCTIYKNTDDTSPTSVAKSNYSESTKATAHSDVQVGKLVLIKVQTPLDLSAFSGKTILYRPTDMGSDTTKQVEFEIKALIGGSIEPTKKLYFLNNPA